MLPVDLHKEPPQNLITQICEIVFAFRRNIFRKVATLASGWSYSAASVMSGLNWEKFHQKVRLAKEDREIREERIIKQAKKWREEKEKRQARQKAATQRRRGATQLPHLPSPEEIEQTKTRRGGYGFSRRKLAAWGVPYPPPSGWRKDLERRWRLAHPGEPTRPVAVQQVDPVKILPERASWILPWETEEEARQRLAAEIDAACI